MGFFRHLMERIQAISVHSPAITNIAMIILIIIAGFFIIVVGYGATHPLGERTIGEPLPVVPEDRIR